MRSAIVLILAVACLMLAIHQAEACGGFNGGASQSACTSRTSYSFKVRHHTCSGWFLWKKCRWEDRYETRYRVSYSCRSSYTRTGSTCHRNGGWSGWGQWGSCSSTSGSCSRRRSCSNPSKYGSGKACSGSTSTSGSCSRTCPIVGAWSAWGSWSHCAGPTGSCGRTRRCDSPAPKRGGKACTGSSSTTSSCAGSTCPVDGSWSSWTHWSHCKSLEGSCGRFRECDDPRPGRTGKPCPGDRAVTYPCTHPICPVDGSWSGWAEWSHCSSLEGDCSRTRACDSPSQAGVGKPCYGPSALTEACSGSTCPVDGAWSAWAGWSHCSALHDGSECSRKRFCDQPTAANGGLPCLGTGAQTDTCGGPVCPVDGGWAQWTEWSGCEANERFCFRHRWCAAPLPVHSGQKCQGDSFQMAECRQQRCQGNQKEGSADVETDSGGDGK